MATKTIGDLKASVHFRLANTRTVAERMSTPIQEALGAALSEIVHEIDSSAYRRERTLELSPAVPSRELPEDFHKMIEPGVIIDGCALGYYSQQDRDRMTTSSLELTGPPRFYTIGGRDHRTGRYIITLWPTPDEVLEMRIHYFAKPQQIWAASDTDQLDPRFDGEWVNALECWAALKFRHYLSPEQIDGYEKEYAVAMRKLKKSNKPVAGDYGVQRRFRDRDGLGYTHRRLDGPTDYVDGAGVSRA